MSEGFAAIPNWMIRDQRFTRRSLLVYAALASRSGPGGIFPSQQTIAEEMQLSERTVRTALGELEALGVIERVRRRGRQGRATAMSTGYVLHPNGRLVTDEEAANSAGSFGKVPATRGEATGKIAQAVPLIEEEPLKKNPEIDFEEFWVIYPRKVGRAAARAKFVSLAKVTDVAKILDGARRYANDPNLPEKQFIPYPTTWLNQGRWEDEPLPPRRDRGGDDGLGNEEWMLR